MIMSTIISLCNEDETKSEKLRQNIFKTFCKNLILFLTSTHLQENFQKNLKFKTKPWIASGYKNYFLHKEIM